jgi:prepilin peptidase CpaA
MTPVTEIVRLAVGAALAVVLVIASVTDIRARLIPNRLVLAVFGLFVIWSLVSPWSQLPSAAAAFAISAAVTITLYALGILGAGDCKLFSALALFAGLTFLPHLAIATALAGGVIGVVSLASRPTRAVVMFQTKGRGDFGRGVPYGVAIAVGGGIVLWERLFGA